MYYIEMLALWRASTSSGVVCLDSRAIWRVSTPSGVVCFGQALMPVMHSYAIIFL